MISQKHVLKPVIVIICNRLNYGLKFEITISQNNYSNDNYLLLLMLCDELVFLLDQTHD